MTAESEAAVLTAIRAAQHIRLPRHHDAYKCLSILTLLSSLGPLRLMLADTSSPHGSDATLASVGTLSEGFEHGPLPRRSNLVGYVRWDARSNQFLLVKQSIPAALQVAV